MKKRNYVKRILAIVLVAVMVASGLPDMGRSVSAAEYQTGKGQGVVSTIDDPQTLTRPTDTYGNSTFNAGKILVGKSVTDGKNDVDGTKESLNLSQEVWKMGDQNAAVWTPAEGNFLVTVSQSSQMYGVSSKIPVPLDVVFIIDTSGSMDESAGGGKDRADAVMAAANSAIKTLLEINKDNRIGVVAFSGSNNSNNTTTVLSKLAHYTTDKDHLTINWQGNLSGNNGSRNPRNGGTNIQAGIAAGAQMLMGADNLQVKYGDRTVTRIPILILLSDGAPTFSSNAKDWTNPTGSQNGRGSDARGVNPGEGFLPMLTAAYYKNAITNKYYGESSTANERAFFYTIGVGLGTITQKNNRYSASPVAALANLTMNPSQWLDVSMDDTEIDDAIRTAWNKYQNKNKFSIEVGKYQSGTGSYDFEYHATSKDEKYNIDPSVTSLKYNDQYWLASSTEEINRAFSEVVIEIQKRAISVPTLTDINLGQNFSGYVNFADPIGEYMEVKEFKGVTGDGYLYDGKRLAKLAAEYDPNWANTGTYTEEQRTLFAALEQALFDRIKVSNEAGDKDATMDQVRQILNVVTMKESEGPVVVPDAGNTEGRTFDYNTYGGQLYYQDDSKYGNSFTWFGKLHYLDKEAAFGEADYNADFNIGFIGVAPKNADSVNEWLKKAEQEPASDAGKLLKKAKDAGANVIVRSYFMYGADADDSTDMLHYQLRVITSLSEPHQQYVSIKVPASLLAMQSVLIDDTNPAKMVAHYDDMIPTRVTYEVGLRGDITPENIWSIVDSNYINEYGNMNADGSINFYTNDFKRYDNAVDAGGHTGAEHDHAYTNATFDVHDSNSFYRYEKDTQLLDASGKPVRTLVTGQTYYYERVYYEWTPNASTPGEATAAQRTALIPVIMTEGWDKDDKIVNVNGYWYVKEGTYTAFTVTRGDDQLKTDNETVTAHVISHPQRTNDSGDSHYTVWLGNNGRLTYVGVPSKTVYAYNDNGELVTEKTVDDKTVVANIDGQMVKVGDKLNYQIQATNNNEIASQIQITDTVPTGTALAGSKIQHKVGNGSWTNSVEGTNYTYDAAKGILTWTFSNVAPGQTVYVRFDVIVTEDAVVAGKVDNEGQITVGKNTHSTNVTTNPVTGKRVTSQDTQAMENGVTVGTILEYQIAYHNDKEEAVDFVITDHIPEGTVYMADSASHSPALLYEDVKDSGRVTGLKWTFNDVAPGVGGVVTFEVILGAGSQEDGMEDGIHHDVDNQALIKVDNDPEIKTNVTNTKVKEGDLSVTKVLKDSNSTQTFTLTLTERRGTLNGTYATITEPGSVTGSVTFVDGVATLEIQGGQTILIKDLPAGAVITVAEQEPGNGFTSVMNPANGVVVIPADSTDAVQVVVTNTYHAAAAEVILGGTKYFTNNGLYDETRIFNFELVETQDDVDLIDDRTVNLVTSVEMNATAGQTDVESFSFTKLSYAQEGTFYYQLSEVDNNLTGVTYDLTKYRIKVVVEDNQQGQLVATVYQYQEATTEEDQWILLTAGSGNVYGQDVFTYRNKYAPLREELKLVGKKTLTNALPTNDQFSFLVEERVQGGTESQWAYEQRVTGQSKDDGSIVFTSIVYSEPGEHIYRITEVTGAPNMIYGGEIHYIKVVVAESNGVLSKTVYYNTSDSAEGWRELTSGEYSGKDTVLNFANIYDPGYTSVVLEGTKVLEGRDMAADEFDFIVNEYTPATDTSEAVIGAKVASGSNLAAENGAAGKIIFQPINYSLAVLGEDKTETFYYIVREVNEGQDNITYSTASYIVAVTVTYSDATGWSTNWSVIEGGNAIAFENTYTPDPISVYLTLGQKITTGENLPEGLIFGYEVTKAYSSVEDGVAVGAVVAGGTSGANTDAGSAISLSALTFSKPGTYKAWLYEVNAGQTVHGITYDNSRYLLEIVVTQNPDTGILSADVKSYAAVEGKQGSTDMADYTVAATANFDNVVFTNQYNAQGSLTVQAKKTVTNRVLAAGAYSFELVQVDPATGAAVVGGVRHIGANQADGTIVFDTLNYTQDDLTETFVYNMKEVVGGEGHPGVFYDLSVYQVTVTLATDSADGSKIIPSYEIVKTHGSDGEPLDAPLAVEGWPQFTNIGAIYQGVSTTLELTKTLIGRMVEEGEFSFALHQISPDPAKVEDTTQVVSANNGEAQKIVLDISISATEGPGTYVFELSEINNHAPGVTYDQSVYRVEIVVDDTNTDGILDVVSKTITQVKDAQGLDMTPVAIDTPSYINRYMANHVEVILVAGKTLTGRTLKTDEFDFEVYEIIRDQENEVENRILRATGSNDAAGEIVFTPLTFTKAGTYEMEVQEITTSSLPGVTHDDKVYSVVVVVTDDTVNGKLVATVKVDGKDYDLSWNGKESSIQFVNEYKTIDAKVKLEGTKTLTGRSMNEGEFTFYAYLIKEEIGSTVAEYVEGEKREAVGTNGASDDGVNAGINFSTITYSQAGVYTYKVVESALDPSKNVVQTGTGEFQVVVTVVDDGRGNLVPTVEYAAPIAFTNVYDPTDIYVSIGAFKDLTGKNLQDKEFTFEVKDATGTVVAQGQNQTDGVIVFDYDINTEGVQATGIKITKGGTYYYTIAEVVGSVEGMTYDSTPRKIKVEVDDDGLGKLTATVTYEDLTTEAKADYSSTAPVFNNVYDPKDIPIVLDPVMRVEGGSKVLEGRPMKEAEFLFHVKDLNGALVAIGHNKADGSIVFDYNVDEDDSVEEGIMIEHAGIYRYSIEEIPDADVDGNNDLPAMTYDPAIWYVQFEVIQNADGTLEISKADPPHVITVRNSTADIKDGVYFTNTYDAKDAELTLIGTKVMTGHRTDVTKGEFTFNLIEYVEVEGLEKPDAVIVASATNDDQGVITFDKLTYDQAGVYDYELVEVYSSAPGVKYDPTVYQVQVTVYEKIDEATGNYLGELVVDYTIKNKATGENADAVFTNVYTDNVVVPITVTKQLIGRDLKAEEFTFVINDANGLLLAIGKNDAAGSVVFDKEIKLAIGTHQLSISEQVGTDENVTYDTSTYQVMVEVTSEDGDLVYSVTYPEGGIVFKNTYEKPKEPAPEPEPTPEPPVPPAANPDTGDTANMGLWLSVLAASVMMILQVIHDKKRRSDF